MLRARPRFRMEVDGELFEVLAGQTGSHEYEWISGPNQGYGFGSSRSDRPNAINHGRSRGSDSELPLAGGSRNRVNRVAVRTAKRAVVAMSDSGPQRR